MCDEVAGIHDCADSQALLLAYFSMDFLLISSDQ